MAWIPLELRMGMPQEKLMVPCVPFTNITVDLMGPYMVSDMIRQRVKLKVWVTGKCSSVA